MITGSEVFPTGISSATDSIASRILLTVLEILH